MPRHANDNKSPVDPAAAHIEISLYPYRDNTAFAVVLARGVGRGSGRLRVLAGHLPVRRADLRGLGAADVAKLLSGALWDSIDHGTAHAVAEPTDSGLGAPGAPLGGPQGEAWEQLTLQWGTPNRYTPGGIAHV